MIGYITGYGTRSRFTKRPTSGRLRISKITLPTYIEAMKPQKRRGSCWIRSGPGVTPCTIMAASSRGHRHAGNAQGQHRHEGARGRRVVRRLRPRHPRHRAAPELLRAPRDLPLDRVRHEGGDHVRGAGDDPDEEADHGAAPDRRVGLAPLPAGG